MQRSSSSNRLHVSSIAQQSSIWFQYPSFSTFIHRNNSNHFLIFPFLSSPNTSSTAASCTSPASPAGSRCHQVCSECFHAPALRGRTWFLSSACWTSGTAALLLLSPRRRVRISALSGSTILRSCRFGTLRVPCCRGCLCLSLFSLVLCVCEMLTGIWHSWPGLFRRELCRIGLIFHQLIFLWTENQEIWLMI